MTGPSQQAIAEQIARLKDVTSGDTPAAEVKAFLEFVMSHGDYLDPDHVAGKYRGFGFQPFAAPHDPACLDDLKEALANRRPYSAVRIGDGEANFLAYGQFPRTPHLNHLAMRDSINQQQDRFEASASWMTLLGDLMRASIETADLVGVLGLWRPAGRRDLDLTPVLARMDSDLRGVVGHWRGVDLLIGMAEAGDLEGKTIASAHFYFAALADLDAIIDQAERIVCLTDKTASVEILKSRVANKPIDHVPVGSGGAQGPAFFGAVQAALPQDMAGVLALIGAGPWAEIYCRWVKARGGVALDLGSGFDIIAGAHTRAAHNSVDAAILEKFRQP